jgi:predicted HicB family RNase H-like nuclease
MFEDEISNLYSTTFQGNTRSEVNTESRNVHWYRVVPHAIINLDPVNDALVTLGLRILPTVKTRLMQEAEKLEVSLSEYAAQVLTAHLAKAAQLKAVDEKLIKLEVALRQATEKLAQTEAERDTCKEQLQTLQKETPKRLERVIHYCDQANWFTSQSFRNKCQSLFDAPLPEANVR